MNPFVASMSKNSHLAVVIYELLSVNYTTGNDLRPLLLTAEFIIRYVQKMWNREENSYLWFNNSFSD